MCKMLFDVRNIGKAPATRKAALEAPAIELTITTPCLESELKQYILIENKNIPGYANTKTATEEFRSELPIILSGKSQRWKLWEVVIYEDYISLNYADAEGSGKTVTALSLHLSWATVTVLSFRVPAVQIPLNDFRVYCLQGDKQHRVLEIAFTEVEKDLRQYLSLSCKPLDKG